METIIPIIPESHKVAADEELAKRHRGPGHEQYRSRRRSVHMPDETKDFYSRQLERFCKEMKVPLLGRNGLVLGVLIESDN